MLDEPFPFVATYRYHFGPLAHSSHPTDSYGHDIPINASHIPVYSQYNGLNQLLFIIIYIRKLNPRNLIASSMKTPVLHSHY